MLSINYLSNFLAEEQLNIDNTYYDKINKFEKKIIVQNTTNVVKENIYPNKFKNINSYIGLCN